MRAPCTVPASQQDDYKFGRKWPGPYNLPAEAQEGPQKARRNYDAGRDARSQSAINLLKAPKDGHGYILICLIRSRASRPDLPLGHTPFLQAGSTDERPGNEETRGHFAFRRSGCEFSRTDKEAKEMRGAARLKHQHVRFCA
uniref:Uncharacterized protein n=1 Tax=Steinernema glaseri TaxID=37863 RepID=A0A1I8AEW1_9BILA